MIERDSIVVGDVVYYVQLDIVFSLVCTGLITFPGKDHFMIQHQNGAMHNAWCTKSKEEAVLEAKNYREKYLCGLEKELRAFEEKVKEAKAILSNPIEIKGE